MVIKYSKLLLSTTKSKHQITPYHIGIVTPYKKQADLIKSQCEEHSMEGITVGTAAILQGQEKPIIIISTVSVGNVSKFAANFRVTFF